MVLLFLAMIVHLILAKLSGKLVRDHVTLERPVHEVHCNCELIPNIDDLRFRKKWEKNIQPYQDSHPCPDLPDPIFSPALTLAVSSPS